MFRKSAFSEKVGWRALRQTAFSPRFWYYRLRWRMFPPLDIVASFPTHVDIEMTNACNLRCIMCPHGIEDPAFKHEFKKSLGMIRWELVQQVLDEGGRKGLCSVKFNWRGEPLLNRKLMPKAVRYAKQKGVIEVAINTNGLPLDDTYSEELIAAGLDRMIFSIDGDSTETYEAIRRGGDFEKLVGNIRRFVEIRDRMGKAKPLVRLQMVKMDANVREVDGFLKRWQDTVDSISFQEYTNRGESQDRLIDGRFESTGRLACPQIWQRLVVAYDGKIVMCCRDWESENVLGQLDYTKGHTVEYFWKGPVLEEIRLLHRQKRLDEVAACKRCEYKESYSWKESDQKLKTQDPRPTTHSELSSEPEPQEVQAEWVGEYAGQRTTGITKGN